MAPAMVETGDDPASIVDAKGLRQVTDTGAIDAAVDKIIEMRRHLVLEKTEFPKEMQTAFRGMETNGKFYCCAHCASVAGAKGMRDRAS